MIIQPHCFIDYQEIKDQKVMEKLWKALKNKNEKRGDLDSKHTDEILCDIKTEMESGEEMFGTEVKLLLGFVMNWLSEVR
jgi:hypothetical protein